MPASSSITITVDGCSSIPCSQTEVTVPDRSREAAIFGAEHSAISTEPIPQQGDPGNWPKADLANRPPPASSQAQQPQRQVQSFAAAPMRSQGFGRAHGIPFPIGAPTLQRPISTALANGCILPNLPLSLKGSPSARGRGFLTALLNPGRRRAPQPGAKRPSAILKNGKSRPSTLTTPAPIAIGFGWKRPAYLT